MYRDITFPPLHSFFFFNNPSLQPIFREVLILQKWLKDYRFFLLFFKFQKLHLFLTNFTSIVFHSQQVIRALL